MGRPRKTLWEHVRDNTFRWDRNGKHVLGADRQVTPPTKPKGLRAAESRLWDAITKELAGVVSQADVTALTMLVKWVVEWEKLHKQLVKETPGTPTYSRVLRALSTVSGHLGSLAARFGLDPVSREKLPPPMVETEEDTEAARLKARYFKQRTKVRPKQFAGETKPFWEQPKPTQPGSEQDGQQADQDDDEEGDDDEDDEDDDPDTLRVGL